MTLSPSLCMLAPFMSAEKAERKCREKSKNSVGEFLLSTTFFLLVARVQKKLNAAFIYLFHHIPQTAACDTVHSDRFAPHNHTNIHHSDVVGGCVVEKAQKSCNLLCRLSWRCHLRSIVTLLGVAALADKHHAIPKK